LLLSLVFNFTVIELNSAKLEKAYEALSIYDYFLAKKLFLEMHSKKADAYSSYGLSVIFSRNDNPFSNIDSAGKYIRLSYQIFQAFPQPITLATFSINSKTILLLADSISLKMFEKVKLVNTATSYEFFLSNFYLANRSLQTKAVFMRDELEYKTVLMDNKSGSTLQFLKTHPQSEFYRQGVMLMESQIYEEMTLSKTAESYRYFIHTYPNNNKVNLALEKLFTLYVQTKNKSGLADFVRDYPNAHQTLEAWKLLFSLSVKDFSFEELEKFTKEYPDFPLKKSILNELELNKLVLYPYQLNDYSGFIDSKGKFAIQPVYDAVSDFSEGLSVVTKNDSVFYVNKKNLNPFNKIYSDALVFKNGIAAVKQNNQWYFINRQGQSISKPYDEINELTENIYVVKIADKCGALDHFGQVIIEPKFDKLGDFKNGYAYYVEQGYYGFVSKSGATHKAEFEWISDFNSSQIAIFQQNNKYGLVNSFGIKILEAKYDQILKTNSSIFIVVVAGKYGFFSSEGCFLTDIGFDYLKEKTPDYYTNGTLLRLIKNTEQAFLDENGRMNINFGAYQEMNFVADDLICVKQKNKHGYVDRKLNLMIPYKYEFASDFSDSLALVKFKDQNMIINREGFELFASPAEIVKISKHYFLVNDDLRSLINLQGEPVYTDISSVQKMKENILLITLNNGQIKLLND